MRGWLLTDAGESARVRFSAKLAVASRASLLYRALGILTRRDPLEAHFLRIVGQKCAEAKPAGCVILGVARA